VQIRESRKMAEFLNKYCVKEKKSAFLPLFVAMLLRA